MVEKERPQDPEIIKPVRKLFIANRGEIAVRAALACERRGIQAVIPYAFPDANSLVTRMADRNKNKGWELAVLGGTSQEESYANPTKVLEAARIHGCDSVFLGYGFLAENADFVRRCEEDNLRVLAPSSDVMEKTGNKILAREIAKEVKMGAFSTIPVLEGSQNLPTFRDVIHAAREVGLPGMMKDPDLGGGLGNLIVRTRDELKEAYTRLRTRRENTQLFLEHFIENAVHVEVQIVADKHGNVVSLGERDCTMQRRSQKVIEESPSPHISDRMREEMQTAAVKFAQHVGYTGVGTWEFIVDRDAKGRRGEPAWYFMEVNPRIQVEHGVTELQTGIDIVDTMIDVAEGRRLRFTQKRIQPKGHTMEARVYGEKPERGFEQGSGRLEVLKYPALAGVRIDKGAEQGDDISPWFDPTICKLIAHGDTRDDALRKLSVALTRLDVIGVPTNRDFLLELLNTDAFRKGEATTTFIDKWWKQRQREKIHDIGEIVNGGRYEAHEPSRLLDPTLLPQDVAVVSRTSGEPATHTEFLRETQEKTGKECAAEFGIVERDGVRFVMYSLDSNFAAATLGASEAIAFEDACKLAHNEGLALITLSRSGGVDQRQNSVGLATMTATTDALVAYPPLFHINVYAGGAYGGVPASLAGAADIQIAVDSQDTKIGFTGPYIVAKSMGKEPKSFRAADAYAELPEGTHTPVRHFQERTVDILVGSLQEASDKITHLLHTLKIPTTITESDVEFSPSEQIGFLQTSGTAERFDRRGSRVTAWIRHKISEGTVWRRGKSPDSGEITIVPYEQLPIAVRSELLMHPERPTAADLIDKRSGIFDDVVSLSSVFHLDRAEQYPSVVAAIANLDGQPIMVLGQQTQKVFDEATGKQVKKYDPQKPADWDYTERMLDVAEKLHLPVMLLGDTRGADCLPDSEDRDQSHKIAHLLKRMNSYPFPSISINIGMKGSGGGETFIRPLDAAADFENALSYVSDPMVQYWILTGRWIDEKAPVDKKTELTQFVEQLKDATAQGRLDTHQIDAIIPEGKGGAHVDPRIPARALKEWVTQQLEELKDLPPGLLLARRHERTRRVIYDVTRPVQN